MYLVKMLTRIYIILTKYQTDPLKKSLAVAGPSPYIGLLALARAGPSGYNKSMKKYIFLFLCLCLGGFSYAQKVPVKNILSGGLRSTPIEKNLLHGLRYAPEKMCSAAGAVQAAKGCAADRAGIAARRQAAMRTEAIVNRRIRAALAQQAQQAQPTLAQTEKHIRSSLVEVVGRASGELMGSGFVVRAGSGRLYAVVSYHVVGRRGNTVAVRIYPDQGEPVLYNGLVVNAAGSFGINAPDAAIIALPQEVQAYVHPLKLAPSLPQKGNELVVWGSPYASEGFARIDELKVTLAQGIKIVMDSPDVSEEFNGLCGSPVLDAQGRVVGIYSGHDPERGLVFAVNARQTLEWLVGSVEQGLRLPPMVFKVYGRKFVQLQAEENIGWVYHFDASGTLLQKVYLPKYPGPFDPEHAEKLFPDVRPGDMLEFEIVKHRFVDRTISVGIS